MEQTIYAYWNGKAIYDILNAVVLVTGGSAGGAYAQLMAAIALLALLVTTGVAIARVRGENMMTMFIALTFFYGIFFVPKTTVYIDDVRLGHNYHVENVPLGLALFGGVTSKVGYWLTNAYETYFTSVDDEKFSHYGFLFGTRVADELPKTTFRNQTFEQNVRQFIISCVNPELDENPAKINVMVKSTDMWQFITGAAPGGIVLNPGRITPYINPTSGVVSTLPCTGGGSAVTQLQIDAALDTISVLQLFGKRLFPGESNTHYHPDVIASAEQMMLGISRTAQETVLHYASINSLREVNEDKSTIFAATMAAAQQEQSYKVMRILAEGALPKIRNFIEGLIYAVFPIVFLIVIAAGPLGGKVLTAYAMTAVWVQLWAPLYAVINSFMTELSSKAMTTMTEGLGGTIEYIPHMMSMSASDLAIAGLMTISVPAIALAVVKGGAVAMSGVVNSLMSPGQGAAAKTGGEVGLGNISVGRVAAGGADLRGDTTKTMPQTTLNTPHGSLSYGPDNTLAGARPNTFGTGGASVGAGNESRTGNTSRETGGSGWTHDKYAEGGNKRDAGYSEADKADFMRQVSNAITTRFGADWRQSVSDSTSGGSGGENRRIAGSDLNTSEVFSLDSRLGLGGGAKDQTQVQASGSTAVRTTEPGGGVSGGKPGAGQAAAGSPATATTHSNALSRARALIANLGLDLGMGGGSQVAQKLSDVVRNENGQFTREQQEASAQILHAAVNDVMGSIGDEGRRSAGRQFAAQNGFSAESRSGDRAAVGSYQRTDGTIEQGNTGTTSGQVVSESAVWFAARAMVAAEGNHSGALAGISGAAGDMETMRRLATDEGFKAEATRRAMAAAEVAHEPLTGNADRSTPATEASVLGAGNRRVEGAATRGDELVAETRATAEGRVQAQQLFSPMSMPNLEPAAQANTAATGAAQARYEEQGQQAQLTAGINSLAEQLHRQKEHGMSKVLSIYFAGAAGYDSPGGYVQALQQAAQDPELAAQLRSYSSGRDATEGELQQIFDQAKRHLP